MRHGALFNGIGGFQLAASWLNWQNVFHCEIDKFCNQVVKQHFPQSICYEDIKQTDFTSWRGAIDIITGGFPCQPYSLAGKRKGDKDDRHLRPEMLRAIGEIRPRWVVGENVPGLVNWGNGVVFQQIQTDLEAQGYEVFPPVILPACGKEAPHERSRVWIIANACKNGYRADDDIEQNRCEASKNEGKAQREERDESLRQRLRGVIGRDASAGIIADAQGERCGENGEHIGGQKERAAWHVDERITTNAVQENGGQIQTEKGESIVGQKYMCVSPQRGNGGWDGWPTQHPVCRGDDGVPAELAGLSVTEYRRAAIGALGNAIVPQVALEIFKAIESYEKLNP